VEYSQKRSREGAYVIILACSFFKKIRWTKQNYLLLEEDAYPIELYILAVLISVAEQKIDTKTAF